MLLENESDDIQHCFKKIIYYLFPFTTTIIKCEVGIHAWLAYPLFQINFTNSKISKKGILGFIYLLGDIVRQTKRLQNLVNLRKHRCFVITPPYLWVVWIIVYSVKEFKKFKLTHHCKKILKMIQPKHINNNTFFI